MGADLFRRALPYAECHKAVGLGRADRAFSIVHYPSYPPCGPSSAVSAFEDGLHALPFAFGRLQEEGGILRFVAQPKPQEVVGDEVAQLVFQRGSHVARPMRWHA